MCFKNKNKIFVIVVWIKEEKRKKGRKEAEFGFGEINKVWWLLLLFLGLGFKQECSVVIFPKQDGLDIVINDFYFYTTY